MSPFDSHCHIADFCPLITGSVNVTHNNSLIEPPFSTNSCVSCRFMILLLCLSSSFITSLSELKPQTKSFSFYPYFSCTSISPCVFFLPSQPEKRHLVTLTFPLGELEGRWGGGLVLRHERRIAGGCFSRFRLIAVWCDGFRFSSHKQRHAHRHVPSRPAEIRSLDLYHSSWVMTMHSECTQTPTKALWKWRHAGMRACAFQAIMLRCFKCIMGP